MDNFSKRLIYFIQFLNLTAYKLAKEIDTSEAAICNFKSGKSKPSYEFLQKLITRYEFVNLNWLISGKGKMILSNSSDKANPNPEQATDIYPKSLEVAHLEIIQLQRQCLLSKDEKIASLQTMINDLKNVDFTATA